MITGVHLSGGTLGAVAVFVLARYGYNVSDAEANTFGLVGLAIGGWVAHLFTPPGLLPRIRLAIGPWKLPHEEPQQPQGQ